MHRRYPEDAYDRLWDWPEPQVNYTTIINSSISNSPNSFAEAPDRPPVFLMEDALVKNDSDSDSDIRLVLPLSNTLIYAAAYFQELDGNASATNVRGMHYYWNSDHIQTFNVSNNPLEIQSVYNLTTSGLNVTFVQAGWSRLRPMLNALEFYYLGTLKTSATAAQDGETIWNLL